MTDIATPSRAEVLRAVNTEMDCLLIGALDIGPPMRCADLQNKLDTAMHGQADHYLPLNAVGSTLRGLPAVFVETLPTQPHGYRKHAVNADTITARAGHHLALAEKSGIPLRRLVGEHVTLTQYPTDFESSLEVRWAVLQALYNLAHRGWVAAGEVYEILLDTNTHPDTTKGHLMRLTDAELLERQPPETGNKSARYRVASQPSAYKLAPLEIIQRYLKIGHGLGCGDPQVIERGLNHMEYFLSGRSPEIGDMVIRCYASTERSGKRKTAA